MSTTPLFSTITITIAAPQQTKPIPFTTTPRFLSPFSGHHQLPVSSSFRRSSSSNNPPAPAPETQCPVPRDQQPINEYNSLSTSFPFSWAAGDPVEYVSRLFALGASFTVLVGLPVAWFGTVGAESEPLERVLCGASSGVLVVTLAVMRMYLGWAYVGNRLLSATVEYEETGWYDGQIWVKTAEVLARDRLLGSFSVKPVLNRLKITLVSLGTSLLVFALILFNINGDQSYQSSKEIRDRVIPGVYSDESAKSFEPDAFCGEPDLEQ